MMSSSPSFGIAPQAPKATIGKSVVVKGQIHSREDLTVEGEVEGTIEMAEHRLTINPHGNVHAGVKARVVEIQGAIEGKVEAVDKVYIRKGATFVGDIHSMGIVIDDGGYIKGSIDLSQPKATERASSSAPSHSDAAQEAAGS
jgi:cytoskeletal protein CcmA (bactofilin family)